MQHLNLDIIEEAKKEKMKDLESKLKKELSYEENKGNILCPMCHYVSEKTKKPSAFVFKNDDGSVCFKCFACGVWRRL